MKSKRFTEEQIITMLKESEAGAKTKELCRRHRISEATFYNWKAKYPGMTVSEASRTMSQFNCGQRQELARIDL